MSELKYYLTTGDSPGLPHRNADGLTGNQVEELKGVTGIMHNFGDTHFAMKWARQIEAAFPATFAEPEPVERYERTNEWAVPKAGQLFEGKEGVPTLCKDDSHEDYRWILRQIKKVNNV